MVYVVGSETAIPLPSNYADFVFTVNALDHVDRLDLISAELRRILAPGGELIASLNLNEPASVTEPQELTEERVAQTLLVDLEVLSYRRARMGTKEAGGPYVHMLEPEGAPPYDPKQPGLLWVRARKPDSASADG